MNTFNAHHLEMAESFVLKIADALKSYGELKNYNLSDQFYSDLAWGGLLRTEVFKDLPLAQRKRIENVIQIEQYGKDMEANPKTQKGKDGGC